MNYLSTDSKDSFLLSGLSEQVDRWTDRELLDQYRTTLGSFELCITESDYGYWTRAFNMVEEEIIKRGLTYGP